MPGEGLACVAGGHIPQADFFLTSSTGEGFAIRTEDNVSDTARMPGESG